MLEQLIFGYDVMSHNGEQPNCLNPKFLGSIARASDFKFDQSGPYFRQRWGDDWAVYNSNYLSEYSNRKSIFEIIKDREKKGIKKEWFYIIEPFGNFEKFFGIGSSIHSQLALEFISKTAIEEIKNYDGNLVISYFIDGGFRFRQATLNVDLSKNFKSIAKGLNIGYGFEYRNEKYGINKGEEASYSNYDPNGVQGSGSQGFPGFSPSDVVDAKRNSLSVYVDGELNVTDKWLVDAAVRAENYSDFGSLATFKLATRYKVADGFNLRGSASTGYRAPSLQQLNFSNTLTSFIGSNLIQSRLVANYDEVAQLAGIPALKQETSQSASLGFASNVAQGFSITIDGYVTKGKDRVVISGLFYADDASLPTAFTDKLNEIGVGSAQFFANAVNTTNYGVDIVVDYTKKWNNKTFKALLAGNFQELKIDKINVPTALNTNDDNREAFFGSREVTLLKSSAPQTKFNLSMSYSVKKLSVGTNLTYFGNVSTEGFGDVPTDVNPNLFVSSL